MSISVNNHSNFNNRRPKFGRNIDVTPKITINSKKMDSAIKWIHENIASHDQRLVLGITALGTQPFIDLNNKKVDEDTRKISCAKTLAKIIAGTTLGYTVRFLCTKLANGYTQVDKMGKKAKTNSFLAPAVMNKYTKDKRLQYINAIGSILGVITCIFTNFLIDAPLTKILTNKFSEQIKQKDLKKGVNK